MGATSILVLDGGLGTSLEDKYDVHFDSSTPLWSSHLLISEPETLVRCQKDFVRVPVDILLTPTYQISIEGFSRTKTKEHCDGIDRSAIKQYLETALCISEEATCESDTQIALSLGPYGASMIPSQEYSGAYDTEHSTEEQLYEWHLDRLRLFLEVENVLSRVSYIAFETIPRADEIVAVRRAVDASGLLATNPALKIWISCVFPGDDMRLPDGSSLARVKDVMVDSKLAKFVPWGIGINCTKIHKLRGLVEALESHIEELGSRMTLVLYPDGTNGEVYNTTTQKWELPAGQLAPERSWESCLADIVLVSSRRGMWANIVVGGCCKATSEDLRRLRELLFPKQD